MEPASTLLSIPGSVQIPDTSQPATDWPVNPSLLVQLTTEPDNLHPTQCISATRADIFPFLHRYLVTSNHGTLEPDIVREVPSVAADGLTYSFRLRRGLTWDDGSPVTADDVRFTCLLYIGRGLHASTYSNYWLHVDDLLLNPNDPLAFLLVMKEASADALAFLTSFPLMQASRHDPDHVLRTCSIAMLRNESYPPALTAYIERFNQQDFRKGSTGINGLGLYRVKGWLPGEQLVLERKKPGIPREIIFRFIRDDQAALMELRAQRLDISLSLSMSAFMQAAREPDIASHYHCLLTPTYNYTYLCFNERPKESDRPLLFNDLNTRRALAMSINIDQLIDLVYGEYGGAARRINGPVSPLKAEYDPTIPCVEENLGAAQRLLDEAGWKQGAESDGTRRRNDQPLDAELLYLNTSADWKDMALLIAEQVSRAGIHLTLKPVDQRTFQQRARQHDFDLLLGAWGGSSLKEDFAQLWHTESWKNNGSNYSGFGNDKTDELIQASNHSADASERKKNTSLLVRSIQEDQPYVFLYTSLRRMVIHKRWKEVRVFPDRPGWQIGR